MTSLMETDRNAPLVAHVAKVCMTPETDAGGGVDTLMALARVFSGTIMSNSEVGVTNLTFYGRHIHY